LGRYIVKKFIKADEIGEVFNKADLVVGRAGAHFASEILALRKPSVLIPISWVSHNEQVKNAQMLEKYGLAVILNESNLTEDSFKNTIFTSLNSLENFEVKKIVPSKLNSAELIVNEISKIIKKDR
jgi:UDP-N-acetylglucosamine--N-acetylmuramyl-(pentapeptide) pyrophosphoryl-undecaprenol N-acetylglucosamine transferase